MGMGINIMVNARTNDQTLFKNGLTKGADSENETVVNAIHMDEMGASLSISSEGMDIWQENSLSSKNDDPGLLDSLYDQLESSKDDGKAFDEMAKLMEIARRISHGDKVPPGDERKLMEFNSEVYQAAKAAAAMNESGKHKEYDTLIEDEENGETDEKVRDLRKAAGSAASMEVSTASMEASVAATEVDGTTSSETGGTVSASSEADGITS